MTQKPIQLPKQTIEALLNVASMFIIPIDESNQCGIVIDETREDMISFSTYEKGTEKCWDNTYIENFINKYSPLQIGDEFYVQEEFLLNSEDIIYKDNRSWNNLYNSFASDYFDAQQMTYEQSRLKDLVTVNVEIKRVQDLSVQEKQNICILERNEVISFSDWIKKQKINYEENPYVFLVTAEKKK